MGHHKSRRRFLQQSALLGTGMLSLPMLAPASPIRSAGEDSPFMVGPLEGFSPQVGTLLSSMRMMRAMIFQGLEGLTVKQLDWHLDDDANSIGAMLWHLAATERYYQLNTFEGIPWGEWEKEIKDEWDVAMSLGKPARKQIKGHDLSFYLDKLNTVRAQTEAEFAKRDDDWLMESEPFFGPNLTNNHAKWFHVCEHESNHNGQIKFIKKRLPK